MNKILIVGADGLLGRSLLESYQSVGYEVVGTTRRRETVNEQRLYLDLSAPVNDYDRLTGYSLAYLCAGIGSIDACRTRPEETWHVNVAATCALAHALAGNGTFVVFPSTTLVFDRSRPLPGPYHHRNPQSEYGRQKLAAEAASALGGSAAIVRLGKVFWPDFPLFADWIETLTRGGIVRPFLDLSIAPLTLPFAIQVLRVVGDNRVSGITHATAASEISYAAIADRLCERLGSGHVQPIWGDSRIHRPGCARLDCTRLRLQLGLEPPDPWEAIDFAV